MGATKEMLRVHDSGVVCYGSSNGGEVRKRVCDGFLKEHPLGCPAQVGGFGGRVGVVKEPTWQHCGRAAGSAGPHAHQSARSGNAAAAGHGGTAVVPRVGEPGRARPGGCAPAAAGCCLHLGR